MRDPSGADVGTGRDPVGVDVPYPSVMTSVLTVPDATVIVALITVVAGPVVAARMATRRVERKVDASVGVVNGSGTVVTMLERCLANQAELASQVSRHHEAAIDARDEARDAVIELRRDVAEMRAAQQERWRLHDADSAAYRAGQADAIGSLLAGHLAQHHNHEIGDGR